ncbi:MAG TPA: hypothetical protein PKE45_01980 [Caldilineaceae bacterium]|nr:hypothetical protein [Caldilineaceae bacterium]
MTALLALPTFRLRTRYVAIATPGIGEIINQVILHCDRLTNGARVLTNLPPRSFIGWTAMFPGEV